MQEHCHLVDGVCAVQNFFKGLTTPEEQGMEGVTYQAGAGWFTRLFFDVSFFIILGVLLFDMVTGIIVDTFGELREETEKRKEKQANS